MKPNRRDIFGVGIAGAAALLGAAVTPMQAHTGTLPDEQVKKLALEPKTAADYKKLEAHFRVLKTEADKESAMYEAIAKAYRKGIVGATEARGRDAARALEHVAEHARDSAEALDHLVETFAALAETFNK